MFNDDSRSTFLSRFLFLARTDLHYHTWFKKRFSRIDVKPEVWGIWNISVYGPNIELNGRVRMFAADGSKIYFAAMKRGEHEGEIKIGDNVLVMSGVRISSASSIIIGDHCMLANYCYIMDADWHDIYDRMKPVGKTAPVRLEKNVWIGDSAIICKGVTIGENSIVGAGSVVTRDIPPNVIVAGNPAEIVREIDPEKIRLHKSPEINSV
jgi:acetyltransferase-like isoleucine patch superfamily enzyme